MPGRIARQSESYGVPDAQNERIGSELPDPSVFADLLGGPRITAGMLHATMDDDE